MSFVPRGANNAYYAHIYGVDFSRLIFVLIYIWIFNYKIKYFLWGYSTVGILKASPKIIVALFLKHLFKLNCNYKTLDHEHKTSK